MQYTMLFFLVLVAIATSSTAIASREWPYGYKMPKWIQNIQNATAPDQSDISEESKELDISLSEQISTEGESKGGCESRCNEIFVIIIGVDCKTMMQGVAR